MFEKEVSCIKAMLGVFESDVAHNPDKQDYVLDRFLESDKFDDETMSDVKAVFEDGEWVIYCLFKDRYSLPGAEGVSYGTKDERSSTGQPYLYFYER